MYVCARRFDYFRTAEEYKYTIFFPTPSRRTIVNNPRAFESSSFSFYHMRLICATLLIIHIRVQVNYQLFIYQ